MVNQSFKSHIGNLHSPKFLQVGPLVYYSASSNTAAVYEFEDSALLARGVVADAVDSIAGSRHFKMVKIRMELRPIPRLL